MSDIENNASVKFTSVKDLAVFLSTLPTAKNKHFYLLRSPRTKRNAEAEDFNCAEFFPQPDELKTEMVSDLCQVYTSPQSKFFMESRYNSKIIDYSSGLPSDYISVLDIADPLLLDAGISLKQAVDGCKDRADLTNGNGAQLAVKLTLENNQICILFVLGNTVEVTLGKKWFMPSSNDGNVIKLDKPLIHLSKNISMIYYQNHLYILNEQAVESFFNLERAHRINAQNKIKGFIKIGLIDKKEAATFEKNAMRGQNARRLTRLDQGTLQDLLKEPEAQRVAKERYGLEWRPGGFKLNGEQEKTDTLIGIICGFITLDWRGDKIKEALGGTIDFAPSKEQGSADNA
ncbi:MAG: DUF4868 domain-containing protein [Succinivibrio sp.]|nr:DUF4868 domain-containing protein [Succinivibrio sp.]